MRIEKQDGSIPIVTAVALSAAIYIGGNTLMDSSLVRHKISKDKIISDQVDAQFISAVKKIDQITQKNIFNKGKGKGKGKGKDQAKSGKLEFNARGKNLLHNAGWSKKMNDYTLFHPSYPGEKFLVKSCKYNSLDEESWGKIFSSHDTSACEVTELVVDIEQIIEEKSMNAFMVSAKLKSVEDFAFKKSIVKTKKALIGFYPTMTLCSEFRDSGKLRSDKVMIDFRRTNNISGTVCKNLNNTNGYVSGLNTQTSVPSIPNDRRVCGIKINSKTKKFQFDDGFALTLNNVILATGLYDPEPFDDYRNEEGEVVEGLKEWDFADIEGNEIDFDNVGDCGVDTVESGCKIPVSDKEGDFLLDPSEIANELLSGVTESKKKI